MLISVVICTYRRVEAVADLLVCLQRQTYKQFEILVIDGSGSDSPAHEALQQMIEALPGDMNARLIPNGKGLTLQRNRGIDESRGQVIAFVDDDITFGPDFLERVTTIFQDSTTQDLGGVSGYDVRNFPTDADVKWRLRRMLGTIPSLEPGAIDRLGRAVPLSFFRPFKGCKTVGHLYGFCMIFRRAAIGTHRFDELLPTYAGEDRDFSSRVGRSWRLAICGELQLEHHYNPAARVPIVRRVFEVGFGSGRSFGKNATRISDYLELARLIVCDIALDALSALGKPSLDRCMIPFARALGVVAGVRSWHRHAGETL